MRVKTARGFVIEVDLVALMVIVALMVVAITYRRTVEKRLLGRQSDQGDERRSQ